MPRAKFFCLVLRETRTWGVPVTERSVQSSKREMGKTRSTEANRLDKGTEADRIMMEAKEAGGLKGQTGQPMLQPSKFFQCPFLN